MDDETSVTDLVGRATAGDAEAWDALVERYSPLVLSIIRGYRLQDDDVRDIVQTVWLRLVEHLGALREPRALPGWLVTTSRNETLRALRSGGKVQPVAVVFGADTMVGSADSSIDDDLLRVERREAVLMAFAELSARDRTLLALLASDPAVPYVEIGQRLNMSVGSIGPTRARILAKLRAHPCVAALTMAAEAEKRSER